MTDFGCITSLALTNRASLFQCIFIAGHVASNAASILALSSVVNDIYHSSSCLSTGLNITSTV